MAADRQKPARLEWRKPVWLWASAAFIVGGPLNPLALGAAVYSLADRGSVGGAAAISNYLILAGPASASMAVSMLCWLAPRTSLQRLIVVLSTGVAAAAAALAISAAVSLEGEDGGATMLDARISLGLAVMLLSLVTGGMVAASAGLVFRYMALRPTRKRSGSRGRIVRPREVGSA